MRSAKEYRERAEGAFLRHGQAITASDRARFRGYREAWLNLAAHVDATAGPMRLGASVQQGVSKPWFFA
jgi:hypothetical protein